MGYVRFEIDDIKDLVFQSLQTSDGMDGAKTVTLPDAGGALMRDLKDHFTGNKIDVIHNRSGDGLLKVERDAEAVSRQLKKTYEERAKDGTLTAVHCDDGYPDDFKLTYALLNYKLRDAVNDNPWTAKPARPLQKGEETGWREVHYLESLLDNMKGVGVKDSNTVLIIYGDLNEAGNLFASMDTLEKLGELSRLIYQTLKETREQIQEILYQKNFKALMPVAGGDDLIIFVHPAAFDLIKDHIYNLEQKLETATGYPLKMNVSLIRAKHNFPIHNMFTTSEELLKLTKNQYYKEENPEKRQTHYGFHILEEGVGRPGLHNVYTKTVFEQLFRFARQLHGDPRVSTSAIFQLLDLLPVTQKGVGETPPGTGSKEDQFNIEYHLSLNPQLAERVTPTENGFQLSHIPGLPLTRQLWEHVIHMKDFLYGTEAAQ